MKAFLLSACIAVLAVSSASAAEDGKHLFILSGQSNMGGLDPRLSFIPAVEAEFGKDKVLVVRDAQGGQPISRWYKNWPPGRAKTPDKIGDLYDRLMTKIRAAASDTSIATVSFVWMQGESDASRRNGDVYAASLKGLMDQLSVDLKRDDLNMVIGRISDARMNRPEWVAIRDAQVRVADDRERVSWIDTDDLNDGINKRGKAISNDVHYAADGYVTLGQRFADAAIALIKAHPSAAPTPLPAGD